MYVDELLAFSPFSISQEEKVPLFSSALNENLLHHYNHCLPYKKLCDKKGLKPPFDGLQLEDVPYLPTAVFKRMELSSLNDSNAVRILHSSATTSNQPSRIILDNVTRNRQIKSLIQILAHYLGNKRRPFLVMDLDPALTKSDLALSARGAAVRGFLTASSKAYYCMKEEEKGILKVDIPLLFNQLSTIIQAGESPVLLGYTYVIYEYVAKALLDADKSLRLPKGTQVLHLGGWKKLKDKAVSKHTFNQAVSEVFGVPTQAILDAYGFTEQLGIVYIDSEDSPKRCPITAEVIIRDTQTLKPLSDGEIGFIQLITPIPHSYPGTSILLEDLGRIVSRQPSWRGEHGATFEILGRSQTQEVRGCGDVLSERLALFR